MGTLDAVADIVGVCLLMHMIHPDQVLASPVHVGSGHVHCAHGILPVPAPATAYLLQGIPSYSGNVEAELCTPTGAALLRHFVSQFGDMPTMCTEKIGYGMGKKEFQTANCVRAMLGETTNHTDDILELRCNLDDMTGEAMTFACQELMSAGALDVFTTAITMKKGRPAVMLTCLCRSDQRENMVQLIFRYTTTLGIRENVCHRYILSRSESETETAYGPVNVKRSSGYGVQRSKLEYEDRAQLMRKYGISWAESNQLIDDTH